MQEGFWFSSHLEIGSGWSCILHMSSGRIGRRAADDFTNIMSLWVVLRNVVPHDPLQMTLDSIPVRLSGDSCFEGDSGQVKRLKTWKQKPEICGSSLPLSHQLFFSFQESKSKRRCVSKHKRQHVPLFRGNVLMLNPPAPQLPLLSTKSIEQSLLPARA